MVGRYWTFALVALLLLTSIPSDLFAGKGGAIKGGRSSASASFGPKVTTLKVRAPAKVSVTPEVKVQSRDVLGRYTSSDTPAQTPKKPTKPIVNSLPANTQPLAATKYDSAAANAARAEESKRAYQAELAAKAQVEAAKVRAAQVVAQAQARAAQAVEVAKLQESQRQAAALRAAQAAKVARDQARAAAIEAKCQQSLAAYRAAHPLPIPPKIIVVERPVVHQNVIVDVNVVRGFDSVVWERNHRDRYGRFSTPNYRAPIVIRSCYHDNIDSLFYRSLLAMSAIDQANWAWRHQRELDRQRLDDLRTNAQFSATYNALAAANVAQDLSYQPKGVSAADVYNETYLKEQAKLQAKHDAEVTAQQKFDAEQKAKQDAYAVQQAKYEADLKIAAQKAAADSVAQQPVVVDQQPTAAEQELVRQNEAVRRELAESQRQQQAYAAQLALQNANQQDAQRKVEVTKQISTAQDQNKQSEGHGFLYYVFLTLVVCGLGYFLIFRLKIVPSKD
ncbi:MAG: hypothetical protein HY226_01165 [Candidatus Vogelbacteria bacterium]|nr:hypothetical protein [Candidatus Vogelbacteria bacterium]